MWGWGWLAGSRRKGWTSPSVRTSNVGLVFCDPFLMRHKMVVTCHWFTLVAPLHTRGVNLYPLKKKKNKKKENVPDEISGVNLHFWSRSSWRSGPTHLAWSTTASSGLISSQVLCSYYCCFFFCFFFVAKAIQIYYWVSRKWICESVLIHRCCPDKMFQSIAVPCCHGRPHRASWRDWTEGLDELLLYCKDSGHTEFSVHFMCRRHYSIANT